MNSDGSSFIDRYSDMELCREVTFRQSFALAGL